MISRTGNPADWTPQDIQRDVSSTAASERVRIVPGRLKELYRLNTLRAGAALAGTWGLILLVLVAALWSRNLAVCVIAIIMVGRCQHALAVLMHDAAHFRMSENRALNDWIGQWLCAFPIASNLYAYRNVHLKHHRFLLTDEDPDLSLSRPYPVTWRSLRRKLIRDATGVSSLVMRGYLDVRKHRAYLAAGNLLRPLNRRNAAGRIAGVFIVAGLFYCGYGIAFLLLWVFPLLTVYQLILRLRGVLEHAAVPDTHDGLRNARTIISHNPLMRFLLGPHHVAYHLEHHLYPAVPHYRLPALHRELAADPRFESALVETTYTQAFRDLIERGEATS